uniref:putative adhesin n=1 Tax=Bordetella sputigena TaxID=1416810 RepID=UPI0039EF4EC2
MSSTHYGRYVLWQGRKNSELVISSHGSHVVGDNRRHIVPSRMALHFYGPDYAAINTHLVDQAFIRENVASHPYEIRSAGQAYLDYELSKIQVRPGKGKGETYNHIIECLSGYDLVTIEQLDDDGPYEHILLSELITHLVAKGHRYSRIHCFFCRSLRASDLRRHPSLEQFVRPAYVVR